MAEQSIEWVTTATVLNSLKNFQDQTAWNKFANRFSCRIKAFAIKLGVPPSDLEDAAQDVLTAFAESYRGGHYDRSKGRLSSWLFGIAYRQIANFRRKQLAALQRHDNRGAHTTFWGELPDEQTAQQTWCEAWESHDIEECVQHVRSEVAENTFRAFEMTVREGQSPDIVAAALGMSRNAVYVAKHRVLNRLQELMKQDDEESQSPSMLSI
jgi:RNA polymerase sigma-70 factor, ECF subfamily